MPLSSPPTSDLKEAPIWEPTLRERTVRPKTSPNTSSMSQPGRSFIVEMSMAGNLQGELVALHQDLRSPAVARRCGDALEAGGAVEVGGGAQVAERLQLEAAIALGARVVQHRVAQAPAQALPAR